MYIEKNTTEIDGQGANLRSIQSWLQQQLLLPGPDMRIENHICSTSKLSSRQHLAIYQRSYIIRLRECMALQFPALAYALGEDLFQNFTDVFLGEHPSHSYTLADLGKGFAQFLEESRPDQDAYVKESWPDFMIELARFEYQINTAFDEQVIQKETHYSSQDDDDLILTPVLHLFKHRFPISIYYKAYIGDQKPSLPFEQESYAVLIRRDYKLGLFEIHPSQYIFLKHLKEHGSVEMAKHMFVEEYSFSEEEIEKFWNLWKTKWLEEGFFDL
ncbi:DNA-binding domain-containing protein [Dokdonia sp.]|uniref:DNA-binding domain-containing protein n=1 Tax=Dokdonia sp. TaxID=2024995 RepID=UPI003267128E